MEAYRDGRDPALEAIARFVPMPSLPERLRPLLIAGDSASAWAALETFIRDPSNAWMDPAPSLARLSNALRGEGQPDAAALADRLRSRLPTRSLPRSSDPSLLAK